MKNRISVKYVIWILAQTLSYDFIKQGNIQITGKNHIYVQSVQLHSLHGMNLNFTTDECINPNVGFAFNVLPVNFF